MSILLKKQATIGIRRTADRIFIFLKPDMPLEKPLSILLARFLLYYKIIGRITFTQN